MRLGSVRIARAEQAFLAGDRDQARTELAAVRDLVIARGNRWQRGEIAWLLWQAGDRTISAAAASNPSGQALAEPFRLQLAGEWNRAATVWRALGCPYEAARALAEADTPMRCAARWSPSSGSGQGRRARGPSGARALGVADLSPMRRGPGASTRANPAGLTPRETEVLALVAAGQRNAEIADRLYLTPKTVGHHVSEVLAKLRVETRADTARAAARVRIAVP